MSSHAVHLFCCAVKMDSLTSFFVAAESVFLFMWPLHGILGGVILEYFTLFRRVSGAMQQSCFPSGWPIAPMACISCLGLASAARLRVGRQGRFSSLSFPAMTGAVGVCPRWSFRSVSVFVYFFCDFHSLEYFVCIFIDFHHKVLAL